MLNYTALHIVNYVIREVLTEKAEITASVPEAAKLKNAILVSIDRKINLAWRYLYCDSGCLHCVVNYE